MRVALRELRRRPGRFLPVGGALTVLVLLLAVLGGFLDGLTLNQTGSYRTQAGRLFVVTEGTELQLSRSRITPDQRAAVEAIDGVAAVGSLGSTATTVAVPGQAELEDVIVYGYGLGTDVLPEPPPPGVAIVDSRLAALTGVKQGDVLELGSAAVEVTVGQFVADISQGSPTIWVEPGTFGDIAQSANPAGVPKSGLGTLVVKPAVGVDLDDLADRIEAAVDIEVADVDEIIAALPVVTQQAATFKGIIGVTFVVTLLVVTLFFALLTLERVRLYAVLKAVGARTLDLVAGVAVQAVAVAVVALVIGGVLAVAFTAVLPAQLPVRLEETRAIQIAIGVVATALAGGLFTLRRILRVDPATAIG